jgi:hypothetical protein
LSLTVSTSSIDHSQNPWTGVKGDSMAKPEHLGIQKQLQRLLGRYDQLIRTVEQTADTVMITNR